MPHRGGLPPEDPNSPASTFAPGQPALGVVADDVPEEQNPAGAPKASDVGSEEAEAYASAPSDPEQGAGPVPVDKQSDDKADEEAGSKQPVKTAAKKTAASSQGKSSGGK